VPVELEEQALIDGASRPKILAKITIPLAAPGIAVTAGFIFLRTWQEFLIPLVLTEAAIKPLPIAIFGQISSLMIYYNEVSASCLVSMIPLVIFFLFVGKHMVRGLTMGSLK
jgi:ABC-type glycerol-3-phosphate transport system permease component